MDTSKQIKVGIILAKRWDYSIKKTHVVSTFAVNITNNLLMHSKILNDSKFFVFMLNSKQIANRKHK